MMLQRGLQKRRPAGNGLRFYTTAFESVSLWDFYKGATAFLVLSGPSLAKHDLSQLSRRGIVSMGVNNSWAVHRPNLWTCVDGPDRFLDTGWRDPSILKFVPMCAWAGALREGREGGEPLPSSLTVEQMPGVLLYRRSDHFDPATFLEGDTVGWGNDTKTSCALGIKGKRSVMLVAIRLLYHLGIRTVYLLGADFKMQAERGYAFQEGRTTQAVRHNNLLYEALNRRFSALRPQFDGAGFRVFNCTPGSGLTAFEHVPYEMAVERAAAACDRKIDTRGWYAPVEAKV
jgi:hypothetical protein